MPIDYYGVLGVDPKADLRTIQLAYRQKARECHPDRGGTHQQMLLLNEAYYVLSDPDRRRHHDSARSYPGDSVAQASFEQDAARARDEAGHYPRRWSDFEIWLNNLTADITNARHSATTPTELWGLRFPVVENSVSGCVLIVLGAIIGAVLLGSIPALQLKPRGPKDDRPTWLLPAGVGGFLGAWLGAWMHQGIAAAIRDSRKSTHAPASEHSNQGSKTPIDPQATRIIECVACRQKMRLPDHQQDLLVTCKKCGVKFDCPANR